MKYYKVECGNGYCGCNEEWVMFMNDDSTEEEIYDMIYNCYSYVDGFAQDGTQYLNGRELEEWWYVYNAQIWENMSYEEVSEEEYYRLIDVERWEER